MLATTSPTWTPIRSSRSPLSLAARGERLLHRDAARTAESVLGN
jgi:hypothetical protein